MMTLKIKWRRLRIKFVEVKSSSFSSPLHACKYSIISVKVAEYSLCTLAAVLKLIALQTESNNQNMNWGPDVMQPFL